MALTGPASAQHTDEGRLEATLTDAEGRPVRGAEVTFELRGSMGAWTYTARTNEQGVASVARSFDEEPGAYELTARFAGTASHLASATIGPFVVEKEDTVLTLNRRRSGKWIRLQARLVDADDESAGIPGRRLRFWAGGDRRGSAVTDQRGVAVLHRRHRGTRAKQWQARFKGDDLFLPATSRR